MEENEKTPQEEPGKQPDTGGDSQESTPQEGGVTPPPPAEGSGITPPEIPTPAADIAPPSAPEVSMPAQPQAEAFKSSLIDLSPVTDKVEQVRDEVEKFIIGQYEMVDLLLVGIFTGGHILLEGVPGVAKTLTAKVMAKTIDADFSRIQFTPDMMPSDILGTSVFNMKTMEFNFKKGPIFTNVALIDEINRSPAKTQAALFEVMEERQITNDGNTYELSFPFMVVATQNPVEQEGTYPLPEAQLDRFLLHLRVDYPGFADEKAILKLVRGEQQAQLAGESIVQHAQLQAKDLNEARQSVLSVFMAEHLEDYLISLVLATRTPEAYDPALKELLVYGASPRATLALDRAARAHAWLMGNDFVAPEDIQAVAHSVLRHRIGLSYGAEAAGLDADAVLNKLLAQVAVP